MIKRCYYFLILFFICGHGLLAQQAGKGPVKIFIMAGQSNMEGKGTISPVTTPGTLEYIVANDPEAKYQFLVDNNNNWVVRDDVWIRDESAKAGGLTVGYGSAASQVGPEIGFGHFAGDFYDSQVLIIKAAWGGRALGTKFRPPSSGWTVTPPTSNDDGYYYTEILRLVEEATGNLGTYFPDYNGEGFEIAGFCWHQGFNDRINTDLSAEYEVNMANFIRDMRTSLAVPNLPFVITTSAMDGFEAYSTVELAQLKMMDAVAYPDFVGNVSVIDAKLKYRDLQFWYPAEESPANEGYHWNKNAKTYTNIGLAMAEEMIKMVPEECPYMLKAEGGTGGVTLTWLNGTETPTNVRILRNGVEIAATIPANPSSYLDTAATPGTHTYELQFTMDGITCDPLSVTVNTGITDLTAVRVLDGIRLKWDNNLNYAGIEIRRNGVVIESAYPGTATSYLDLSPPTTGVITYSLVPTNGSAATADVQISIEGLANALIYEPFIDSDFALSQNTPGLGLIPKWESKGMSVDIPNLFYGNLPTAGNSAFLSLGNISGSGRVLLGDELFESGLLDDGETLWFSFVTSNVSGQNNSMQLTLGTAGVYTTGIPDISGVGQAIGVDIVSNGSVAAATWSPTVVKGSTTGSISQGNTALVVGKITWAANPSSPDQIELYMPGQNLAQPATPVSSTTLVLNQTLFDTLAFTGNTVLLDEIRFGESYDDVIAADVSWAPDTTPPSTDPITWASPPSVVADSAIAMTANTAIDPNGVEYYFTETSGNPGGSNSGWQRSPTFTDGGLDPDTAYTYQVKTRDLSPALNESSLSTSASATTNDLVGERQAFIYEPFAGNLSRLTDNDAGFGLTGKWTGSGSIRMLIGNQWTYGNLRMNGNRAYKTGGGFQKAQIDVGDKFNSLGMLEPSAEMWFSVMMDSDTAATGENRRSFFSIGDGPPDGFGRVGNTGVGVRVDKGKVSALGRAPNKSGSSVSVTDGPVLIVGKLNWSNNGGDDTLEIYLPETDLVLPNAPVSTVSGDYNQKLFTILGIAGGNVGTSPELDEIRFGLSYAEVVPATTDYDTWVVNYNGIDLTDINGDFDKDGVSNNEERIFGTDPTKADSSNPITDTLDADTGKFSYTRRDPALTGLSYKIYYSTDLVSWLEDAGATQVPGDADVNNVQTVAVTLTSSLLSQQKLFVRVKASE